MSNEHLIVDISDLECVVCYSRYSQTKNKAMILSCGHTVCSSCLKNIEECPFCKTEILQKPTKNLLFSSLLERDSQVNKCVIHKRPIELYSEEENKILCSQCLVEKHQDQYQSLQKIESRMKEIKNAEKKISDKKEENKKKIFGKLTTTNENLKRRLDELYEEKLAYDLSNKKKLRKMIDAFTFTEKDLYEHHMGLSKFEENVTMLQESWKENPGGIIAEKILKTSLATKQAIQFYNSKVKQVSKNIVKKEKILEKVFQEEKNCFCESSKLLFEKISNELLRINPDLKSEHILSEIARNYLLSTFEEYGIPADHQEKNDYIHLQESSSRTILSKFSPQIFECSIEKLIIFCGSVSDSKFQIVCEILGGVQALSDLTIVLEEPSFNKISQASHLVSNSKTIERFSLIMSLSANILNDLKKYIESLLNSKEISYFTIHGLKNLVGISSRQNQLRPSTQARKEILEDLNIRLTGNNPLFDHLLGVMEPSLANLTALKFLDVIFGDTRARYSAFLTALCQGIEQSSRLKELNLGFAKVDFFRGSDLGSQISKVIINSNQLTRISLFLAGNELSRECLFRDLFPCKKQKQKSNCEHKLEEFSLTIMQCGKVGIEDIIKYLTNFPRLKKLILRVSRVDVDFKQIVRLLENAVNLKSLVSFDLAVRDFVELTVEEKKELSVCKYRLSQNEVQSKIVFEELMASHLPDYVEFVPEDEEN